MRTVLILGLTLLLSQSALNQPMTTILQPAEGLAAINRLAFSSEQTQRVLARLDKRIQTYADDYEARLLKGLLLFYVGEDQAALVELNNLTQLVPDFRLAHLIRGDILAARSNRVALAGNIPVLAPATTKEIQDQLNGLKQEAWARLHAHLQAVDPDKVPLSLLQLAPNVKRALLVDKSEHRLYVFERQDQDKPPQLLRDFYASTGKIDGNKRKQGDLRTPEGVYFITTYIPQQKLPEKYGIGAFPVDYPNSFDQHQGKSGDGIWLHGTDRIYYSRPPMDSEGCVVLTNLDLKAVSPFITVGVTPIIITDKVVWVDRQTWLNTRNEITTALETWRSDWESRNLERYLSHYADGFWNESFDLKQWKEYKRRVYQGKAYQKVTLSDLSLFAYPVVSAAGDSVVLASFRQAYQSNNFNSETSKRMYLTQHQGKWEILYEGR
ncbi:MAG: L,D-transpeptidase family protein [Gammaproteobacteria bacterium]|nr:L,D-transpeptidase family protein [Gammaproteobacteria bacterium]